MFIVYIIRSENGRYYIGSTEDVAERVRQHNAKLFKCWTNRFSGWVLVYSEEFTKRTDALKREREIKRMKGGKQFKTLLGSLGS